MPKRATEKEKNIEENKPKPKQHQKGGGYITIIVIDATTNEHELKSNCFSRIKLKLKRTQASIFDFRNEYDRKQIGK